MSDVCYARGKMGKIRNRYFKLVCLYFQQLFAQYPHFAAKKAKVESHSRKHLTLIQKLVVAMSKYSIIKTEP